MPVDKSPEQPLAHQQWLFPQILTWFCSYIEQIFVPLRRGNFVHLLMDDS